ncbi:MAG TPA: hypothetical protein VH063_03075 [Gaiellaceae bacterium]|nr:hypothetical protein [Gaiellaceae bacterium]
MLALSLVVVVAAGALVAGATGAVTSGDVMARECGTFPGLAWDDPVNGMKGTRWTLSASGVGCGFARSWAVKLAKRPYKGPPDGKIAGPPGWSCHSAIEVGGGTPGSCRKPNDARFQWGYTK